MPSSRRKWSFAVDRGGTFTDVLGMDPEGRLHTAKLLSESERYADAAVAGIRKILKRSGHLRFLTRRGTAGVRLGTTVATNALLERRGAAVTLLITAGFEDLLEIGNQSRPDIFALGVTKSAGLYQYVTGIQERIDPRGKVETALDPDVVRNVLTTLAQRGCASLAIVLMQAWKNPRHEKILAEAARRAGFRQVSVSHEVLPVMGMVGRGQTTLLEAYLGPVMKRYVEQIHRELPDIPLEFMTSTGGLVPGAQLRARETVLSGPAGGVIACARLARQLDLEEVIGFDMGGTSTDVSRFDGELTRVYEVTTGGISYQTDQLDVETVAAGGGSILYFRDRKFSVGPDSAGARPGPACYGWGGPLTVTDANLLLGRILPETMPGTFGRDQNQPLDRKSTRRQFRILTDTINSTLQTERTPEEVAEGFLQVANQVMGRAIRKISVARGFDLRRHTLICFGGAAPQHACAIARILGVKKIVIHPLAGVLSAYGIALAERMERAVQTILRVYTPESHAGLGTIIERRSKSLLRRLGKTPSPEAVRMRLFLDLRPLGSDTWLTIPAGEVQSPLTFEAVCSYFQDTYRRQFGFIPEQSAIEVVNLRLEATLPGQTLTGEFTAPAVGSESVTYPAEHRAFFNGQPYQTTVLDRRRLGVNTPLKGPAIVVEPYSTVVIEPGYTVHQDSQGYLWIEEQAPPAITVTSHRDPVQLEIFNHLFMSIAEQMGTTLANTAHSVNMKERRDYSCAVFDREGRLVANAPHIPVHLGAMSESVCYLLRANRDRLRPGDVLMTNDPHNGGSHLPDITVVTPGFAGTSEVQYLVASRGHHADIGGIAPGSMPAFSTRLREEGVLIRNFCLVSGGRFREPALIRLLTEAPYPVRNIPERISDLQAQVAANNKGQQELEALVRRYSLPVVLAYMWHIQDNGCEAMQEALGRFLTGTHQFECAFSDRLDDGNKICVRIMIARGANPPESHRIRFDFSSTGPQSSGNLNTPLVVTRAAILYVLRTLIQRDIPLNSGCLRPVEIIVPEGCLLNPSPEAAVAGGNVETSQRIVDILYGALGLAAASQGTMNNFLFGRVDGSGQQYYETIAGGSGAIQGCAGASAVQVHMTNTRITDPEVLEHRFPEVRLQRFGIRRGSGGKGRWRGGDGVERVLRFRKTMHVSILSERRNSEPFGLAGGRSGARGRNLLIHRDGSQEELGGKVDRIIKRGETIVIRTPGGGGFGA